MNVLSLFSGIGGLDLGLERAGMTIVGQVEIDPWCRSILAKHWPGVPRHDDVRTCAGWWAGIGGTTDLVCGGFPCQPTSGAGKREVEADSRWLWPALRDVIRDLRPRYVLVENPSSGFFGPVAIKDNQGRLLGYSRSPIEIVLGDLAACGYDAEWDCVPACFVGAPHIRDRVWIVAYPGHGAQPDRARQAGRSGSQCPPERPVAGRDGTVGNVADAASARCPTGASRTGRTVRNTGQAAGRSGSDRLGGQLADTNRPARNAARPASETVFRPGTLERPGRCGYSERHAWPTEPDVGRVAHGIPARLDRLRGLGNAVVPQVAEHIGRLILEAAA